MSAFEACGAGREDIDNCERMNGGDSDLEMLQDMVRVLCPKKPVPESRKKCKGILRRVFISIPRFKAKCFAAQKKSLQELERSLRKHREFYSLKKVKRSKALSALLKNFDFRGRYKHRKLWTPLLLLLPFCHKFCAHRVKNLDLFCFLFFFWFPPKQFPCFFIPTIKQQHKEPLFSFFLYVTSSSSSFAPSRSCTWKLQKQNKKKGIKKKQQNKEEGRLRAFLRRNLEEKRAAHLCFSKQEKGKKEKKEKKKKWKKSVWEREGGKVFLF